MDFESLKNQVSNLTLYDLKAGVRKVQNAVMNLTEMEAKVREATNADPWGAPSTLMMDIAHGTHNYQQLNEIMPMIYKRFTDKTAEEWRQIYKALQLLEFLVKNGSERVIDDARSHLSLLRMLRQFHYIDQNGKDQGVNVRNRSAELVKLLGDVDTIRAERKKARANRNKYGGVEGGMGITGSFSSGSRYGGFGNDSAGYGGYHGEVYGDGGGFGGRETDFATTQRRGEQFEEYDEEEEGAAPPTSSAAPKITATAAGKREASKSKAPEQDLFDFSDEPPQSNTANGGPSNNTVAAGEADDEFDDFQSAPTPAASQPTSSPFVPLAATATTSSTTQFAAPKPLAPAQSASLNNLFSTVSPVPSPASSILSPSASSVSPPPKPVPAQPLPSAAGYKASGPNYYTSIPASINSQPATTSSAFSPRPGPTPSSGTLSYASSTSAAGSLGKPASKPATSNSGGDVFGSLWSSASSKAGVQSKSTAAAKGPDLASMAKARSQAGIWGAAASASSTTPTTAPAAGQSGGAANPPLGNGLDDLLR